MKRLGKIFLLLVSLLGLKAYSCDLTSIAVVAAQDNGNGTYYYTVQVCLGIKPNYGGTNEFTLDADVPILDTGFTPNISSTYNYCDSLLAFNGQNCSSGDVMGMPPAGGNIVNANVEVTGTVINGNLFYTPAGNLPTAPKDVGDTAGDCGDCSNPEQLCFTVVFFTNTPMASLQLKGAEDYNSDCGSNNCCPEEIDNTIPFFTGVEEKTNNNNFSISSNPSSGIFRIEFNNETMKQFNHITIYNVLGEKIYSSTLTSTSTIVDLSKEPAGIYFLTLQTTEKIITKKLLLNK